MVRLALIVPAKDIVQGKKPDPQNPASLPHAPRQTHQHTPTTPQTGNQSSPQHLVQQFVRNPQSVSPLQLRALQSLMGNRFIANAFGGEPTQNTGGVSQNVLQRNPTKDKDKKVTKKSREKNAKSKKDSNNRNAKRNLIDNRPKPFPKTKNTLTIKDTPPIINNDKPNKKRVLPSSNKHDTKNKKGKSSSDKQDIKDEEIQIIEHGDNNNAEEIEGVFKDQKFWARVGVRSKVLEDKLSPKEVTIKNFSISPERRPTLFGEEMGNKNLQGGHVVAWSAVVRYWTQQLQGSLDEVLPRLEKWLLEDQMADKGTKKDENGAKRARAFQLVQKLLLGGLPIDTILNDFEEAASLFISANQFSSFAVEGASNGGNAEGDAHKKLSLANNGTKNIEIKENAFALIDKSANPKSESAQAKVVDTWYTMLCKVYPNLEEKFKENVFPALIWGKSVEKWQEIWSNFYKNNKQKTLSDLSTPKVDKPYKQPIGVWAIAETQKKKKFDISSSEKDNIDVHDNLPTNAELTANQVDISGIEIPAKLRARTQFRTQQSHVIAWTFKRQSLEKMMVNRKATTAKELLQVLYGLAELDKNSLGPKANRSLQSRSEKLCDTLLAVQKEGKTLAEWTRILNYLLVEYIEVNQAHPMSTYSGAGNATGHAEGNANKVFSNENSEFTKMQKAVTSYVDFGIIYTPLVKKIIKMSDLKKVAGTGKRPIKETKRFIDEIGNSSENSNKNHSGNQKNKSRNNRSNYLKNQENKSRNPKTQKTSWKGTAFELLQNFYNKKTKFDVLKNLDSKKYIQLLTMVNAIVRALDALVKKKTELNQVDIAEDLNVGDTPYYNEVADFLITELVNKQKMILVRKPLIEIRDIVEKEVKFNSDVQQLIEEKIEKTEETILTSASSIEMLMNKQKGMIDKLMSDFFLHLQDFHPGFHKDFTDKGYVSDKDQGILNKKAFLKDALLAPLSAKDKRIGEPLISYTEIGEYEKGYMENLKKKVKEYVDDQWGNIKDVNQEKK